MASRSAIEWTEATWNPSTGCDRISAGCDNCYAMRLAGRLKRMGQPRYQIDGDDRTSGPGFGVQTHSDVLKQPFSWRRSRVVFVNSMSDLFHAQVPRTFIEQVFGVMEATPRHTYQVLTKRPRRARLMAADLPWPANVWLGVSVENAAVERRVHELRAIPAAVRFLSCEPLLGPVHETLTLAGLDWVIAGGESGPGARPVDPCWVRGLRDACEATDVPFFFKQWGGRTPKAGGRELDGRTWDAMPSPRKPRPQPATSGAPMTS